MGTSEVHGGVTVSPSVVLMGQDAPESSSKLVKVFFSPLCSDPEGLATGCRVWSSSIREGWSLCWLGLRLALILFQPLPACLHL